MERLSLCGVAQRGDTFFVAQRKPGGSQGGKWEFPGGKGEGEEAPDEALIREFDEELHVPITVGEHFFTGKFQNNGKTYHLQAFFIVFKSEKFILEDHQRLLWCTLADMEKLDLSDSDRLVLEALKSRFQKG